MNKEEHVGFVQLVGQCRREGKKEVMLRVFWRKVKYIEGILGIEILFCRMEGKNGKKKA
jgi:hypothetical protein